MGIQHIPRRQLVDGRASRASQAPPTGPKIHQQCDTAARDSTHRDEHKLRDVLGAEAAGRLGGRAHAVRGLAGRLIA